MKNQVTFTAFAIFLLTASTQANDSCKNGSVLHVMRCGSDRVAHPDVSVIISRKSKCEKYFASVFTPTQGGGSKLVRKLEVQLRSFENSQEDRFVGKNFLLAYAKEDMTPNGGMRARLTVKARNKSIAELDPVVCRYTR